MLYKYYILRLLWRLFYVNHCSEVGMISNCRSIEVHLRYNNNHGSGTKMYVWKYVAQNAQLSTEHERFETLRSNKGRDTWATSFHGWLPSKYTFQQDFRLLEDLLDI